jgi:hypothetical protein
MRNFILPAAVMALMSSANAQQSAYGQCGGVSSLLIFLFGQLANDWLQGKLDWSDHLCQRILLPVCLIVSWLVT